MIASLIVLLYLAGAITMNSAITSLYVAGALLIIAELGAVSFGMIAFNGLLALYAAYTIQSGNDMFFGFSVGWPIFFGLAIVETLIIVSVIAVHIHLRKIKATSGTESMIGDKAVILEWNGLEGNVRYDGEIWKACSETELTVALNDTVTIDKVDKLILTVSNNAE